MATIKLRPSSASRWLACQGSAILEAAMPEETSDAAAEGIQAHGWAEEALRSRIAVEWTSAPEEFIEPIQAYVDYVLSKMRAGSQLFVEQRLLIPGIENEGTSDAVILHESGEIEIFDLKFGRGVKVFASTSQLKLYALGAINRWECTGLVTVHIIQPRLNHIDSCVYSVVELKAWLDYIVRPCVDVIGKMESGLTDLDFKPGEDQCRFCKVRHTCQARADKVKAIARADFEPKLMSLSDLAKNLAQVEFVRAWCKDVEEYAHKQALAGSTVPGFKLVQGREGNRDWVSVIKAENALRSRLGDMAYDKKIISPTQAEKVLGKKGFDELSNLIIRSPGKPILVKESDRRPAFSVSTKNDYTND